MAKVPTRSVVLRLESVVKRDDVLPLKLPQLFAKNGLNFIGGQSGLKVFQKKVFRGTFCLH